MLRVRRSHIAWCDFSGGPLNFVVRGKYDCPTSSGCLHCYVPRVLRRLPAETTTFPEKLAAIRNARFEDNHQNVRGAGSRPIAFVCDTGDLFHERVPDDFITRAIKTMADRKDADFVVLTKRAWRLPQFSSRLGNWPENVWLLVSVENQAAALGRIPCLLQVPAAVRGLSCEPLLEPITLAPSWLSELNWVIVGGESGPNHRPFQVAWAEAIWEQCQDYGVAFFGKQVAGAKPGIPLLIRGRVIREFPAYSHTVEPDSYEDLFE